MKQVKKRIQGIPVVCWGESSAKGILAFHGDQSHKEDTVIQLFAEAAVRDGYQVWSFDLPEHGERKGEAYALNPQNVLADTDKLIAELAEQTEEISLFGCSIGAYFGMLATQDRRIKQSFFLSPVVDMQELIENMLIWFHRTLEELKKEKRIETPINTLDWEYYSYVAEHPISWKVPTKILYGENDNLTLRETIENFSEAEEISLTVVEAGEHFFHTPEQLDIFQKWLKTNL